MPRLGQKHTQETRQKMSKSHADFRGERNPYYGKTHSSEVRQKISASRVGRGHKQTETTRRLISQSNSGIGNPFYGKKHTEETLSRLRDASLQKWSDPKYVAKIRHGRCLQANKIETRLQEIIDDLSIPYKYVGDGQFLIGSKMPDFVNIDGQKKIIELLGCYWHGCIQCYPNTKHHNDFGEREQLFKSFGYQTLGIWEHEFDDVETLRCKLLDFNMMKVS